MAMYPHYQKGMLGRQKADSGTQLKLHFFFYCWVYNILERDPSFSLKSSHPQRYIYNQFLSHTLFFQCTGQTEPYLKPLSFTRDGKVSFQIPLSYKAQKKKLPVSKDLRAAYSMRMHKFLHVFNTAIYDTVASLSSLSLSNKFIKAPF